MVEKTEINDQQCHIFTIAAAYSLQKAINLAGSFKLFGEYHDIVMMDDIEDDDRKFAILQSTVCNNLCDKSPKEKHPFCKKLFMNLEMEEMGKVGIFQTVMKKKEIYITPVMGYAKMAVSKLFGKVGDDTVEGGKILTDIEMEQAKGEIQRFIDTNFSLDKLGGKAQQILNKMGVKVDVQQILDKDPEKLLSAGMNLFKLGKMKYDEYQKNSGSSDGSKTNFDIGNILPAAKQILGDLMTPQEGGNFDDGDMLEGDDDFDMDDDYEDYEDSEAHDEPRDEL